MLIGILQTGLAPDTLASELGDYPDMFARLLGGHGFTFKTWRVVEGEPSQAQRLDEAGAMTDNGDLHVMAMLDELRLAVVHEGRAGDLALTQATLMQIADQWREVVAATFDIKHAVEGDVAP